MTVTGLAHGPGKACRCSRLRETTCKRSNNLRLGKRLNPACKSRLTSARLSCIAREKSAGGPRDPAPRLSDAILGY